MRFEIKPPYVIVHDDKPAEGVTLHVNNVPCPLNGDASSFSDAEKRYAWAFDAKVKEEDIVAFSTNDRSMWGVVLGGAVRPKDPTVESVKPPAPAKTDDVTPAESPGGFLTKVFGKKPAKDKPKKSKK